MNFDRSSQHVSALPRDADGREASARSPGNPPTKADGPPHATFSMDESPAGSVSWSVSLRQAIRSARELYEILELPHPSGPETENARVAAAVEDFPVFAPREYTARMRKGDPDDPLLRQVLPLPEESDRVDGFGTDPVGDLAAVQGSSEPGAGTVLKKYPGRALLVVTGACAVHCRYCFRRHFPYERTAGGLHRWSGAVECIATDSSIEEVILSGGDPLTLRDHSLRELVEQLAKIPHLRRLRIHSRLPIMIPSRINDALLHWMTGTRLQPVFVLHANHPNELTGNDVVGAVERLTSAGVPMLNQSVLLRGVNDSVEALELLSRRLVSLRVMPYYLHHLDRVAGAAHFQVPVATGRRLVQQLRARVSGYMVPRYVVEVAGRESKSVLE